MTDQPTSAWTAQQIVEAFPWETVPRFLLRDHDRIYGEAFRCRVRNMGIREVLTAFQSPWQNAYAERAIGLTRRERLGHVAIIDHNQRRGKKRHFSPAEKVRCRERSAAERVDSHLKDAHGGRHVRVRGDVKVACHLAFGIVGVAAEQLLNMLT